MISMSLIGLILINFGWGLQFLLMDKKNKINVFFVVIYSLGVACLVYDGFSSGFNNLAIANLFSLVFSLAVLTKLRFY